MANNEHRRGYQPSDEKELREDIELLRTAVRDVKYLLDAGYPIKNIMTFVGNHYLLSERQRMAVARSAASEQQIRGRKNRELKPEQLYGQTIHIDGFNTIISLEIAFSGSTLLKCMDGTIRDLAGLRGSYRLIDKTDLALNGIRHALERWNVSGACFYLDAPVSNSGRLKTKIAEVFQGSTISLDIRIIQDVDRELMEHDFVITSDSQILDHCGNWYNLAEDVIKAEMGAYRYVEV